MKARRVGFAVVATVLTILSPVTHATSSRTLVVTVERVSDGDSITAFTSNQTKFRIRPLGIDAVEFARGKIPSLACPD